MTSNALPFLPWHKYSVWGISPSTNITCFLNWHVSGIRWISLTFFSFFSVCDVQQMLNIATLSTLRNSERSEISPYLKVNKLAGNNFIDNGKKPKTPASEEGLYYSWHNRQHELHVHKNIPCCPSHTGGKQCWVQVDAEHTVSLCHSCETLSLRNTKSYRRTDRKLAHPLP